ncbi:BV/ODV-C42 [Epinotia aporema granulovirus]|uniref:BV/ODV-C42 n=1 Tax=Epinotia aporema granulovirus TaxID=166056 RepID=K4EQT7_9BBAC|nr:BV/ODV-C42 [Epinotia aporema granulovirus]AER41506.1 BV/ODV-C42 [Epinotia aporema granulovirus]
MSAKTRLFLTIEKLKNAMDDPQMTYPFWEQFFPLLGNTPSVNIEYATLSDLINEAAEAAERIIVTQGVVINSQYIQNAPNTSAAATVTTNLLPPRRQIVKTAVSTTVDAKKYISAAEKTMNYFVSAGVSSANFTVRDIIKLYLYVSAADNSKHLFNFMESILFRADKDCTPILSSEETSLLLDDLRNLTGVVNIRLDYDALLYVNTSIQRVINSELSRFPQIKVTEYFNNNVYKNEVDFYKAYVDKYQKLIQLSGNNYYVEAKNNIVKYNRNPTLIDNIASNIEKYTNMNRMVYNAVNNIFINSLEQCAAENIRFDLDSYNRRMRITDRVREKLRNNYVDKVAAGDVVVKKRLKTNTPASFKRFKSNKLLSDN